MRRILLGLVFLTWFAGAGFAQHATPATNAPTAHAAPSQPSLSAEQIWAILEAGNQRFVAGKLESRALLPLRQRLASGQSPNVIVLSCSDSRVSPELILDQSLGDLFVVRTAGNIADQVALGSIEYAVSHIHSSVLLVLGHTKCGAVTAACSGEKMPSQNLDAIVDKINPAVAVAKKSTKGDELIEAAIKENVHQSAKDVLANSEIIRDAVKSGKLRVIEAEYELESGKVVRLDASDTAHN